MTEQRILQPAADETPPELPDWLEQAAGEAPPDAAEAPVQQRFSAFGVTAILVILGMLGVIGYALYQRSQSQPTNGPAPKFSITVFQMDQLNRSGEQIKLADLKGKAVVINFWASYCEPCKAEAPMLEQVWREYQTQDVVFLGINTDDIDSDARTYMARYGITYPNAPDVGGRIEDQYRITGIPETFIVNTDGNITRHFISAVDERELRTEIERALRG